MSNNLKPNEIGYDFTNPTYARIMSMTQAEIDAELKANRDSIKVNKEKIRAINKQLKDIAREQKLAKAAFKAAGPKRKRKAPRRKKSAWQPLFRELVGLLKDLIRIGGR